MRWPIWRVAVAESSMEPALRPGDWLLVWRGLPVWRGPPVWRGLPVPGRRRDGIKVRPGQVVIARNPARPEMLVIKRAAWREPGGWWLDSDNKPAGARDSSHFGLVPPEMIEGRVLARYWPPRRGRA